MEKAKSAAWLSRALAAGGIGWTVYLIHEGTGTVFWPTTGDWYWLVVATVIATFAILLDAGIYFVILRTHAPSNATLIYTARLFLIGQIIRHVPGRFWGIVYQINETRAIFQPQTIVRVNLDFMIATLASTLSASTGVIAAHYNGNIVGSAVALSGYLILALLMRFNIVGKLLNVIRSIAPKRLKRALASAAPSDQDSFRSWGSVMATTLLCGISMILYFAAWSLLTRVLPILTNVDMLLLCATYSIAWGIGFLSVITPAGIGVREAAFVFLSGSIASSSTLAFLALFIRAWLMIIDLILFLLCLLIPQQKNNAPKYT